MWTILHCRSHPPANSLQWRPQWIGAVQKLELPGGQLLGQCHSMYLAIWSLRGQNLHSMVIRSWGNSQYPSRWWWWWWWYKEETGGPGLVSPRISYPKKLATQTTNIEKHNSSPFLRGCFNRPFWGPVFFLHVVTLCYPRPATCRRRRRPGARPKCCSPWRRRWG